MVFRTVLIACGIVAVVLSVVAVTMYSVSGEPKDMEKPSRNDPTVPHAPNFTGHQAVRLTRIGARYLLQFANPFGRVGLSNRRKLTLKQIAAGVIDLVQFLSFGSQPRE